jgi:hypothetical protein
VAALLAERKLLLVSVHCRALHAAAAMLRQLLYPLEWVHTFVPVLPRALLSALQSPAPFIMGVPAAYADCEEVAAFAAGSEEAVVVDLDSGFVGGKGLAGLRWGTGFAPAGSGGEGGEGLVFGAPVVVPAAAEAGAADTDGAGDAGGSGAGAAAGGTAGAAAAGDGASTGARAAGISAAAASSGGGGGRRSAACLPLAAFARAEGRLRRLLRPEPSYGDSFDAAALVDAAAWAAGVAAPLPKRQFPQLQIRRVCFEMVSGAFQSAHRVHSACVKSSAPAAYCAVAAARRRGCCKRCPPAACALHVAPRAPFGWLWPAVDFFRTILPARLFSPCAHPPRSPARPPARPPADDLPHTRLASHGNTYRHPMPSRRLQR